MGLFKDIAEPLIKRNVPVIPLRPKTKVAFLTGWETLATTDQTKITEWDQDYVDANGACVAYARPDGTWFLEIDKEGFAAEIEKQSGQKIPTTFMVRSSPGRGHYYFKQTAASIAMGNAQGVDNGGKESWSARVDNRYVVAPGSYHPTSGRKYEILRDAEIVPAPDWLVQWCVTNAKPEKTGYAELDSQDLIVEGGRNNALTSILGKARQVLKMDREQLFAFGLDINQKRCRPPMSDSEVRTIANSVAGYAVKESGNLVFSHPDQITNNGASEDATKLERPIIKPVPYPTFPRWVIKGTSIGKGLVDPICAVNNSYPEFIFMPAMVLMLNYLGLKIQVQDKNIIPSLYLISIGQKGRAFKSSGVQSAIDYFGYINYVKNGSNALKNAEGRSIIWTPGSTEGLGLEMARVNCKNVVMYYDEFKTLVDKASIEKSSVAGHISVMYESKNFANTIKSRKEAFTHEAGQYCASLIACTTDKAFPEQWAKMPTTEELGLDERFFFLFQPETWLPVKPLKFVNTLDGAVKTKALIEKAVLKKTYVISDETMLENIIDKIGGARNAGLVEKIALYFAVDLDKDEVDESCIERAVDIVKYGLAVKKYLNTYESLTKEGDLQQKIIHVLRRNGGAVTERELHRAVHPERYGTFMWGRSFGGLVSSGWIAETGDGTKGKPKQVVLMRLPEEDE
jgi:hypothetical protein